jgi:hypothetical protein
LPDPPPDRAIAANTAPVPHAIDAELIIVAVTPAVVNLARIARTMRQKHAASPKAATGAPKDDCPETFTATGSRHGLPLPPAKQKRPIRSALPGTALPRLRFFSDTIDSKRLGGVVAQLREKTGFALIIVAVTPAVVNLARIARTMRQKHAASPIAATGAPKDDGPRNLRPQDGSSRD